MEGKELETIIEYLPFIIPLIILEFVLLAVTLVHIFKHSEYKRGNRVIWLVITLVGSEFIGPILYWAFGAKGND